MNATEVSNLINKNIVIAYKDGRTLETVLRSVRVHKATNTVAGITYDFDLTSTFEGKTTTRKSVCRTPAGRITSIKAGA